MQLWRADDCSVAQRQLRGLGIGQDLGRHLHVLELLEKGRNREAARELRKHLVTTLNRIKRISSTLR